MDEDELLRQAGIDPASLSDEQKAAVIPLLQAMQASGGSLGAPAADTLGPTDLLTILTDTAQTVAGRRSITGRDFSGDLPIWARDLDDDNPGLFENPHFDPYFGVIIPGQSPITGDERVYMGEKKPKATKKAATPGQVAAKGVEAIGDIVGDAFDMLSPFGGVDDDESLKPTQVERDNVRRYEEAQDKPGTHLTITSEDYERLKVKIEEWDAAHPTADGQGPYVNKGDRTALVSQAYNLPYTWSEEKIAETMKLMRKSGANITTFDELTSFWGSLVDRAAMVYATSEGARKVTPWDVLDMYKAEAKAAGAFTNFENGTKVTTHRSVDNVTEGEAWASMQQMISQMLGHDPSDQEVRDFTYRMNQLAAKNPSITKTITKYKNGEAVTSSSTTSGGFTGADVAQAAYEKAQNDPNYAEYQSATTYFNAALSALGAIGQT